MVLKLIVRRHIPRDKSTLVLFDAAALRLRI